MKLHTLRLALVFALLGLTIGASALLAQDPDFRIVAITAADAGTGVGTDTFGVHSQATYCNDGASLTLGGFVEEELPPSPPTGVFDFRFVDHRTSGCNLGTGQKLHLQEGGKVDTFKVKFQPGDGGYPFTFTWPAGLDVDWDALVIKDEFGGFLLDVDMLTNTTAVVSNPAVTSLIIIGSGKTVDVQREGELIPQRFGLDQNYPNPFNPTTTMKFAVEKTAFTTVAIYNVIGQKVKTLTSGTLTPGFYTATWNGTDDNGQSVTTGVYFARMVANGDNAEFTALRKLLLMK
jgi:hypothetical protein